MVEWANALQISLIGGAFIFAYIASTFDITAKFNDALKLFLYMCSLGMVVASTGINFPIMEKQDITLINSTSVGRALEGIFLAQLTIVSFIFMIMLLFAGLAVVMQLKLKKKKRQLGDLDQDDG